MPSEFEGTFERDRKEWTARKHNVLRQYLHVAVAKLARLGKPIALVDGFAGANEYNQERIGSTQLMAAEALLPHPVSVKVLACESKHSTFQQLQENLEPFIQSGAVLALHGSHSEHVPELLRLSEGHSVIVLLDPDRPSSFNLQSDLLPWAKRAGTTDILGLFFSQNVARIASAGDQGNSRSIIESNLGIEVQDSLTEEEAYNHFQEAACDLKKYFGMYRMRKVKPRSIVYAIYGLSGHPDGLALLSDAVARDYDGWVRQTNTPDLFADDPAVSEKAVLFEELVQCAMPILEKEDSIRSLKLAGKIFERIEDRSRIFGQFQESNYTLIKREALKRLSERK
jgi:three-Cys-motif partner protein